MARQLSYALGAIALAGICGWIVWQFFWPAEPARPSQQPPVAIAAERARTETWQSRLSGVGGLEAVQGIQVSSEISGIITGIRFDAGGKVAAGDVLVELDAAVDQARLAELRAQERQARLDLERAKSLAARDFATEARLDEAETALDRILAEIQGQQRVIDKKVIEAPFAGRLGIRRVSLGQYLTPGQAIVSLQALGEIYANFTLPERDYGRVATGLTVRVSVAAHRDRRFEGQITAIDPQVDPDTRNFVLQATLQNDEELLRPGMFADVSVILPESREIVALPSSAITYNPYGDSVFVIRPAHPRASDGSSAQQEVHAPGLIARRVFVTVGERRGTEVEIVNGVEAGDLVATAGQLKLRDGAGVVIDRAGGAAEARTVSAQD